MADELSIINEYDPEKFKVQQTDQAMQEQLIDPKQQLEQASKENELILRGEDLSIGTPFATVEHTQVHMAFAQSDKFKQAASQNIEILKTMSSHILYENQAQILRSKAANTIPPTAGGQPGQQANSTVQDQAINGGAAKAANPNMQLGPENVPNATGMMQQFNGGA